MALIFVDVCDGSCYTEYFDDQAVCTISRAGDVFQIKGNKEYFSLLARQMVYFASNDFCLPFGAHVHYDPFKHIGCHGVELILEVVRTQAPDIVLDACEELCVEIDVPKCANELRARWLDCANVHIKCDGECLHILGNADGLMYIAKVLLFLVENGNTGDEFWCTERLLNFWSGNAIMFSLV